jgi:ribosomal protein S12 methylthiotransferase accessory factor
MIADIYSMMAKHRYDGTYPSVPPQQTLERVTPFLPAMGITRIANVTYLDTVDIPVVMVCRPNSRSLSVSQGKGLTLAAAKASGVMESIENYHAETITHPLKLMSYNDVRKVSCVADIEKLPYLSDSSFSFESRILWVEGYDLIQKQSTWIPYQKISMDTTAPPISDYNYFEVSTTGLASGNSMLEAIVHGINEAVERDATFLWYLSSPEAQPGRRIDLGTVDDAACRTILGKYEAAEIDVAVWDITSDIGLCTFLCIITERTDQVMRPIYPSSGMGCHTVRSVALLRALTEAAQSRLTAIAGSRDDVFRDQYEDLRNIDVLRELRTQMVYDGPRLDFRNCPSWENATLNADLTLQLQRLQSAGIEQVIAVDLTKPEFNIPVVHVVIPGLQDLAHTPTTYVPRAQAFIQAQRL